jgi:eukaryotic-like serine/threonine-protein kinase
MSDLRTRLDTSLDRYQIESQVGEGGMAVVFLAEDLKHRRQVALKVMKPEVGASLGSERFQREIDIAAKLAHPHILPLYDSGEVAGLHYLVMPYVEGESLRDRLQRDGSLRLDEAVRITGEIAGALEYAHARGLIHRDIKPENILFQSGHAAVTDFGIARAMSEGDETRLTRTGVAVGTVAYMSPEQAAGDTDLDARTDVYALGCVLYEMLEGGAPFAGRTPQAVLASKVTGEVPEFSGDAAVPVTVAAVVRKALATAPGSRYATPAALAEDLETAITAEAITAAAARRRSARRLRVLGAVAVVALLAFGGQWIRTVLSGPTIERVALLPFENERNDPAQDFFIDGMHDALITEMGQAGIEVIGRRSVLRYRDDVTTPVRDIARELNADAVIEGFAFSEGDSVGIRVRLVDGTSEASLWSASFGAEARDIIRLYRQVTSAIAREIDLSLSPEVAARLASAPPVDPAAYEAYLNGMYHYSRLTPQDLDSAERYFELALEIDPDYALAYNGIAAVWTGRQQFGIVSPAEAAPKVRAATQRALKADSTIAEVQYTLAVMRTWTDWDWAGGEEAFRRAIEINPGYAEARALYSHLLVFLDRPEEAVEQADLAVEADPLNSLIRALTCVTLDLVGRYDEAVVRCEEALEADPTQPVARDGLSMAWRGLGRYDEALVNEIARYRLLGDEELARVFEQGNAEGGYERAMALAAETLVARSELEFVPPDWVADFFAEAGEWERALDWLERGFEARTATMPYAVLGGWPEEVQTDPRFRELRRKMGFPGRD